MNLPSTKAAIIIIKNVGTQMNSDDVILKPLSLREVLVYRDLHIPPYQRIYCWQEKTVNRLLNDLLTANFNVPYCMGNIILQQKANGFDIIDGQQRLVTLSLLLQELGMDEGVSLLDEKFENLEAQRC